MLVNSLVQTFFMPNAEEFSELIRTGGLDFALLKPIDTQFLISLGRSNGPALANLIVAVVLMGYALPRVEGSSCRSWQLVLYPLYVAGWHRDYVQPDDRARRHQRLARPQQSLYDFWFYITNFSRYPMEIYSGPIGDWLRWSLHVHAAGAGGRQRAGPDAGQAAASRVRLPGRVRDRRHRRSASSAAAGSSNARCSATAGEQLTNSGVDLLARCATTRTPGSAAMHGDSMMQTNAKYAFVGWSTLVSIHRHLRLQFEPQSTHATAAARKMPP